MFNGTPAAGTWKLFVLDDETVIGGTLTGGWRLTIDSATAPYPSTIAVSGLPPVSDVNVSVNGINSEYAEDINLLLVGPGGQQSYLLGDSGGSNKTCRTST